MQSKALIIVFTVNFYLATLFAYSQASPGNTTNPIPVVIMTPAPVAIMTPALIAMPIQKATPLVMLTPMPSSTPTPTSTPIPTPKPSPLSVQEDFDNSLGLIFSVKKIEEANNLLAEGKIDEAEKKLNEIKGWLINATDYHYNLYQVINKNNKTQQAAKIEKAHALDFANLRDQAFYLLAKIYISQNKLKEATKLLIEIVKSQSESELGNNAYKTLLEIKFSDQVK